MVQKANAKAAGYSLAQAVDSAHSTSVAKRQKVSSSTTSDAAGYIKDELDAAIRASMIQIQADILDKF